MQKQEKKLGLVSVTALGIGAIIGSGIFSALPNAVSIVGINVIWCMIGAAFMVFATAVPMLTSTSTIPSAAGQYMTVSRIVSPYMGVLDILAVILRCFLMALMGNVFATYFVTLVPMDTTIVSIGVMTIFAIINLFGIEGGASTQNILVFVLIFSLLLFIGYGLMFDVDAARVSGAIPEPVEVAPMTFITFGGIVGLFVNALSGGSTAIQIADKMKNPRRDIVLSYVLSTGIVLVLYILMGVVTVNVSGSTTIASLANIAEVVMPTPVYLFFMVGGALFALATTINALLLGCSHMLGRFADDMFLPAIFAKKNKAGTRPAGILTYYVLIVGITLLKLDIFTLLNISSALTVFATVLYIIPSLFIEKKFPHSYKRALFHPSRGVLLGFVGISLVMGVWQIYSMLTTTAPAVWMSLGATLVLTYVYFFARIAYLKKRGIDLVQNMRTMLPEWIETEARFKAEDDNSAKPQVEADVIHEDVEFGYSMGNTL